jgi:eukaryotic-like serine/threonine-protein kinase
MSDFQIGERLGDYEILGALGAGGMGKVYKVKNVISDRVEAMKILLPNLASQKELADRFLREIKVLASLHHPNIAELRTALTMNNQLVMIMEYVEGETLSMVVRRGPIPPAQAAYCADQILDALSYAHQQKIIHRDIKPANMMLTNKGIVKLMDFGIARSGNDRSLTTTGTTLGSLNYMPPEQVKDEGIDARSDIYSLGVSLYEMVTGELPFRGDSNYSVMSAHLNETPKAPITIRPDLPEALNQIILIAMAKDRAQRFQSADAFRAALKNVPQSRLTPVAENPFPATSTGFIGGTTIGGPEEPRQVSAATLQQTIPPMAPPASRPATQTSSQPYAAAPANVTQPPPPASSTAAAHAAPPPFDAPAFQAVPLPPPPSVAKSAGGRGLYVALGALLVVGVLFAAGLYLPHRLKTRADADKSVVPVAAPTTGSAAAPVPAPAGSMNSPSANIPSATDAAGSPAMTSTPPTPDSDATPSTNSAAAPVTPSVPEPGSKVSKHSKTAKSGAQTASVDTGGAQASAAAATPNDSAEIAELQGQADQLNIRASTVSQSLDGLRRQQASSGYGLRGDISNAEGLMKANLSKAQDALVAGDTKNARKYLDVAESQVEKIEKFLGH